MIVAGIDIGNTTTEVVLAEVTPQAVTPLIARRAWTSGGKGSAESVKGAARLVLSAEKALGRRAALLLLPPLRPVITLSASLPSPSSAAAILRRLDDPSAATPAGSGFAVGAHLPLRELADPPAARGPLVVSVPPGADFEEAAERIAAAQRARLPIVAAVVAGDDAVLIANRIPRAIPIVDETDVGGLRTGELIAVEVAEPGSRVQIVSDAVALVAAFGLAPAEAAALSDLALSLADARCAALALRREATPAALSSSSGWLEHNADGGAVVRVPFERSLAGYACTMRPGSVRRVYVPRGAPLHDAFGDAGERVRDVFAIDLPSIRERFFPRQGSVELSDVPIAALVAPASSPSPPEATLAEATGRPVRLLPSEAEAAALGALTTPGAPGDAAVCDMGGGTIDLVWGGQRLTAAGAGELLTVSVARALGMRNSRAEYVKRCASFRVEAPHVVHYEDGSRGFAETSLPADSLGRLCYMRGKTPAPFSERLAPEEWRSLRLAIKRQAIGANVVRCLKWLWGVEAGAGPSTLLLCGGAALDAESVRIVSESLRAMGITVGRANVAGGYGPRYGVALGLLLAFHAAEEDAR
jgi:hypothetical protein